MIAIITHELRDYFHSLSTYIFMAFLLVFVGAGSMIYNINYSLSNFEYVLAYISLGLAVIVPILTMRTIAEERKQKTDQLLYSLPLTTFDIVVGKYIALCVVLFIPLIIVGIYPLIFSIFGDVYLPASYGALFAFFLLGAAIVAIGIFISSCTDSLGFAAGIAIAIGVFNYYSVSLAEYISSTELGSLIALYVIYLVFGYLVEFMTKNENLSLIITVVLVVVTGGLFLYDSSLFESLLPNIMTKLSLFESFYLFVDGVFDITSLVYLLSVIVFFLFLTIQSFEKRRYN